MIFAGIVSTTVCAPLEEAFPALVMVIGYCERRFDVSGPSGEPIPGMRSGTLPATYGRSLHSTVPEYVPGVVPRFQFTQKP